MSDPAEKLDDQVPDVALEDVLGRNERHPNRRKREVRGRTISVDRMSKREVDGRRLLNPDVEALPKLPTTRGQCEPCESCQRFRDAGDEMREELLNCEGLLLCGHDADEALRRSRPCLFVTCTMNLYLDVSEQTGAIKLNFPDLEPEQMATEGSCALDVADGGGATLEQIGDLLNVTRARIGQIEAKLFDRTRTVADRQGLRPEREITRGHAEEPDYIGEHHVRAGLRRLPPANVTTRSAARSIDVSATGVRVGDVVGGKIKKRRFAMTGASPWFRRILTGQKTALPPRHDEERPEEHDPSLELDSPAPARADAEPSMSASEAAEKRNGAPQGEESGDAEEVESEDASAPVGLGLVLHDVRDDDLRRLPEEVPDVVFRVPGGRGACRVRQVRARSKRGSESREARVAHQAAPRLHRRLTLDQAIQRAVLRVFGW